MEIDLNEDVERMLDQIVDWTEASKEELINSFLTSREAVQDKHAELSQQVVLNQSISDVELKSEEIEEE